MATRYLFPPLKEVWAKVVKCGWIKPGEVMPSIDASDNEAVLIDYQP